MSITWVTERWKVSYYRKQRLYIRRWFWYIVIIFINEDISLKVVEREGIMYVLHA